MNPDTLILKETVMMHYYNEMYCTVLPSFHSSPSPEMLLEKVKYLSVVDVHSLHTAEHGSVGILVQHWRRDWGWCGHKNMQIHRPFPIPQIHYIK